MKENNSKLKGYVFSRSSSRIIRDKNKPTSALVFVSETKHI